MSDDECTCRFPGHAMRGGGFVQSWKRDPNCPRHRVRREETDPVANARAALRRARERYGRWYGSPLPWNPAAGRFGCVLTAACELFGPERVLGVARAWKRRRRR